MVQLTEGLGHPPDLKQFGSAFLQRSTALADDPNEAFLVYRDAVFCLLSSVAAN
jgi:hypothetical protein